MELAKIIVNLVLACKKIKTFQKMLEYKEDLMSLVPLSFIIQL